MNGSILTKIKRHGGFLGSARYGIQKVFGIAKMQEEINTLYYLLNSCVEITDIPPAKDEELRLMQKGMLALMKVFDQLCKKYNLTYWLSSGTALGAIRHHGFIPWDDDLDVTMPREDYNKVLPLFKELLAPYGIDVRVGGWFDNAGHLARIGMEYKALETGIWMDIFPMDCFSISSSLDDAQAYLDDVLSKYKKYYVKAEGTIDDSEIEKRKLEIILKEGKIQSGNRKIFIEAPEFAEQHRYLREEDIFPLRTVNFEDTVFPMINNYPLYLRTCFGANYMNFPKGGIETHKDPDGIQAKHRAKKSNTNMREVISKLEDIYSKI